jgi:hypothetical protein
MKDRVNVVTNTTFKSWIWDIGIRSALTGLAPSSWTAPLSVEHVEWRVHLFRPT